MSNVIFYSAEVDGRDPARDLFLKVPVVGELDADGEEVVRLGDLLTFSLTEALDLAEAMRAAVKTVAGSVMYE